MLIKKGKAIRGYKQGINLALCLFIQFYSVIILFSVAFSHPLK
ncbi:putative membrane protein [Helicobacter pylori Hp P-23]|nr:putative membrane protein [Helicobacter pylori Hp H-27]EJC10956.1 putative membrane protein [Helicobacter pylori Hp P-23]EJC17297.1 putative membrane protein [Helicobacter pylori Hp P-74]